MTLLVGESIRAREFEQVSSDWSPDKFVSLCNALVWAEFGHALTELPGWTERVYAKDGGIDAEVTLDVQFPSPTPILRQGWNVLQYKTRDLIGRKPRGGAIQSLKSSVKGALAELLRERRLPASYVLFVNVDLIAREVEALKTSILEGAPANVTRVEVVTAETICRLLDNHPHLRAAYFAHDAFATWEEGHRRHQQLSPRASVHLVGREGELARLKGLVDAPTVRIVLLSGLPLVGKTRLALEATRHRASATVLALDPRSMTLTDYRALAAGRRETVCIVEDPDLDAVDRLVEECLVLDNLKLVVTVASPDRIASKYQGLDERIRTFDVDPLAEQECYQLLRSAAPRFDPSLESWIVDQSGGLAGVLLRAAEQAGSLREKAADLREQLAKYLAKRVEDDLGADALAALRLVSVLSHVGVGAKYQHEIETICKIFGEGVTAPAVSRALLGLEAAGLVRRGGWFVSVPIPFLAAYLVRVLLAGQKPADLVILFGRLTASGRRRLIERLGQVKSAEVDPFWEVLFDPGAPFRSLSHALESENATLLKSLAAAAPQRVLRLFRSSLEQASVEERRAIGGDARRELMWAVEQLLFREKTSRESMRILWWLAEAENETYGNRATGVLEDCFFPWHPQMPLSLEARLSLFREFTRPTSSRGGRLVALRAARKAFEPSRSFLQKHSYGADPLGTRPQLSFAAIARYAEELIDVYFEAAGDPEVRSTALERLPWMMGQLAARFSPAAAMTKFERLVEMAHEGDPDLDVSSVAGALRHVKQVYSEELLSNGLPEEAIGEIRARQQQVESVLENLMHAEFPTRVKEWAGAWSHLHPALEEERADGRYPYAIELEKLVREAIANPALLGKDLIDWLKSPRAERASLFFHYLGVRDLNSAFLKIVEELGQTEEGAPLFASYFGGWGSRDPAAAVGQLDMLADSSSVTGVAVVLATGSLPSDAAAVRRLIRELQTRRATPALLSTKILRGSWVRNLGSQEFEDLLRSLSGPDLENATIVARGFFTWLHFNRPLEGALADLAWRCLKRGQFEDPNDEWDFNRLAARLASQDPDRGFDFLQKLLPQLAQRDRFLWDPFSRYGRSELWEALRKIDKARLFRILVQASKGDPAVRAHVTWNVRERLLPEEDRDTVVALAREDAESATILASWLIGGKAGFWSLVYELHELYPEDEKVHEALRGAILREGTVIVGSIADSYSAIRQEIRDRAADPSVSAAFRAWLEQVAQDIPSESGEEVLWDYDIRMEDLRGFVRDKESPQRLWAIGRLLKHGSFEDISRLLTLEDIEEALPQVDLPPERRNLLERLLPMWKHAT